MRQPAPLIGKPAARRRSCRFLGLALVLLALVLALPAAAAATSASAAAAFAAPSATPVSLTVTAPTGTTTYAQGGLLTVSWTTSEAAASGEFGLWVRSASGSWYGGQLVAASGLAAYSSTLTLDQAQRRSVGGVRRGDLSGSCLRGCPADDLPSRLNGVR